MIHVFPVRMRPEAAQEADFQKLNPYARSDGECYFICLTQSRSYNLTNIMRRGSPWKVPKRGRDLIRDFGIAVDADRRSKCSTEWEALDREDALIDELRRGGNYVLSHPRGTNHRIYVIELRPAVVEVSGVLKENPDRDLAKPHVYVGMTSLTREARFQQHISERPTADPGKRKKHDLSTKYTRDYAIRLAPELNPMPETMTKLQAFRAEAEVARSLREQQFTVTGGH
jgi:hypothetical protein